MKRKEKLIGLFMVLFTMISMNAFAGGGSHDTHYGKVTVTSAGNGSVYVSTSQTAPDSNSGLWKDSNELTQNCGGSGGADSKTYYLHAKPNKGYRFAGWTGDKTSSNNPYRFSQTVKGTESDPNHDHFTATFELIPTYISTAIAVPSANGKVYVSKSNTAPTEYSSETIQDSTHTVVYGSVPKHTYYYYAQPSNDEEYEFVGWSTSADGNIESSNNPYAKEITSNTGDGTTVTLYAIFVQKVEYYTKLNAVGGVGGSVNITSTSDITTEAIENGMSASSVSKQANAPRISYTLVATPESGYQFSGWYSDAAFNNRASQNASYTVNIDGKTDVAEATQTYYAKFELLHDYYKHVYAKAVGEGLVYLGTSNRNISDNAYTTVYDIPNKITQVNAPANTTYYWIAKEADGYNFKGWYNNEACEGTPVSTNTTYNKSISASVDEDVVNALYAKFVPYSTYYAKVSVTASKGGSLYLSEESTTPSDDDYVANMELEKSETVASAPTYTYHIYAQADEHYVFKGWQENGSFVTVSNNTITIKATSTDSDDPTTRNLIAVFEEDPLWTWTGEQVEAAKNFYLYNIDADKFLAGNSTNLMDIDDSKITTWIPTSQGGSTYTFASSNGYRISFQSLVVTGYYRVDEKSGAEKIDVNNVAGNNGYKYTLSCKPSVSYWYVASKDGSLDSQKSDVINSCYWFFISESQKAKYNEYMDAYNAAIALGEGEDDATVQELENIIKPYKYASIADADDKIAGLNNIAKVILNIKQNSYGTFVSQFDVTLPEGVIAYGVSKVTSENTTLSEIALEEQKLTSGNAVILKMNDSSAKRKVYFGPKPTEDTVESNGLIGFYKDGVVIEDGCYVLQNQGSGQKFYIINSSKQDGLTLSTANRTCLPKGSMGVKGAKVLNLKFEEETSIESVSTNSDIEGYYSVNGVKLSTPKAGINIVKMSDGSVKKVLVK